MELRPASHPEVPRLHRPLMALSTLGLLTIGSIPTVIGVAEAIDAQKKQNQQAKDRVKFNLTATFSTSDESPEQQAFVVLKGGKVVKEPEYHRLAKTFTDKQSGSISSI